MTNEELVRLRPTPSGKRNSETRRLVAALSFLLPNIALAHDLWLEPRSSGYVLRYGHRGGELVPLDGAKVKSIRCLNRGAAHSHFHVHDGD